MKEEIVFAMFSLSVLQTDFFLPLKLEEGRNTSNKMALFSQDFLQENRLNKR